MFRLVALEKSALKTCLDRAHVRNLKNMKLFMLLSLWVAFCPPIDIRRRKPAATRGQFTPKGFVISLYAFEHVFA